MPTIREVITDLILEEYEIDVTNLSHHVMLSSIGLDTDSVLLIGKMICREHGLTFVHRDWEIVRSLGDFTIAINRAQGIVEKVEKEVPYEEIVEEVRRPPEPVYDTSTGVQIASLIDPPTESELAAIKHSVDPLEQYLLKTRRGQGRKK